MFKGVFQRSHYIFTIPNLDANETNIISVKIFDHEGEDYYVLNISVPPNQTDWWNSDWNYRIPITLNSAESLTDYQILIKLNSSNFNFSKAKANGEDIRFIDGNKELSYWIEEWSPTNAKIWIKADVSGMKEIYMYYGNPDASSASNGASTFEFFDDFNGQTIMETIAQPYGDPLVCGYPNNVYFSNDGSSEIIELRCLDEGELTKTLNLPSNTYKITSKWDVRSSNEGSYSSASYAHFDEVYGASANLPHRLIVVGTSKIWEKYGALSDGYSEITEVEYTGPIETVRLAFGSSAWDYYYRTAYDYVLIRKYTSSEPSVSIGEEENIS